MVALPLRKSSCRLLAMEQKENPAINSLIKSDLSIAQAATAGRMMLQKAIIPSTSTSDAPSNEAAAPTASTSPTKATPAPKKVISPVLAKYIPYHYQRK